jgi:hypothetical protein
MEELADLARTDRDVARAHAALVRWHARLDEDPENDEEPLAAFRHVAGKRAYDQLVQVGGLHAAALARWVAHLTAARVTRDQDVEWARAARAREAKYALGEARLVSWREAWRGVVRAEAEAEARAFWDAAAERAGVLAPIAKERAARREEVARRLGIAEPSVAPFAEALLAKTRDLWRAVDGGDAIKTALAKDAPEGWPARLAPRWLLEVFRPFTAGLRLDLGPLPEPIGAASFARALAAFGRALRVAGHAPSLPFAIARDPAFVDSHRFAYVFGALAADVAFQQKVLGNVARVADLQSRVVTKTLLFEARLSAMRVLVTKEREEELGHEVLGRGVRFRGAWPRARDDEPSRARALATALPFARELVDRFDVDWFRNPRAVTFVRARASAPAWEEPTEPSPDLAVDLARAFEERLG